MKSNLVQTVFSLFVFVSPLVAQSNTVTIPLQKLLDQPLPVSVLNGQLQSFQYTSQLSAIISVDKNVAVTSAEFYLVVYHDKKIVAGEGWTETNPRGSIFRDSRLAIHSGDHAVLVVKAVKTSARTLSINEKDLNEGITSLIRGEAMKSLPVEISLSPSTTGMLKRE